ncbi:hypothetical protein ACTHAL_001309 [Priestia flexa]|jgi:hypothetical protein|uniref:hypothetical protein n=1 Tax=Priestia flexa TaxID=86664 RepID=UPI003F83ED2D
MDKYIIVFKNGEATEVSCRFLTQKDNLIRFCKLRESFLEQKLYGPEVVFAANEHDIKYFRKVGGNNSKTFQNNS